MAPSRNSGAPSIDRRRHDVVFFQSDAPGLDRAVSRLSDPGSAAQDSELFGRLQRGEPEARAAVFALYEPMVRRLLARILRDDSDVADALQDTFVKVFRSAPRVREHQALRPWVLRVAESIGLDEARRRQRVRSRTADDIGAHEPAVGCPSFEARTALRDAFRLLAVLPKEEQRVLTLRRIDGLELAKIADACEVSLATVKRRLSRASNRFDALARRQPSLSAWVGPSDAQ